MKNMEKAVKDEKKELLNISQEEFMTLINSSECAMFITKSSSEMELIYANDKFYSILQYTKEEYTEKYGKSAMATVLNEEKQKLRNLIARQAAAGGILKLEYRAVKKDHSIAWISLSAKAVIKDNQLVYYGSCLDVTKSKKTIDDIYNAKREIDVMANSIPGGVIKARMSDYKLIYANDGYFLLTGYSRAEFSMEFGSYCNTIIYKEDKEDVLKYVKMALENNGLLGFECRINAKNNCIKWIYVSGRRIEDDNGHPVYLCVLTDITDKKKIEFEVGDNLRRAEVISNFLNAMMWTYDIKADTFNRSGNFDITYSQERKLGSNEEIKHLANIVHPDDTKRIKEFFDERRSSKGQSQGIFRIRNSKGIFQDTEISAISICRSDGRPDKIYGMTRVVDDISTDARLVKEKPESRILALAKASRAKAEDKITGLMPYSSFLSKADKILKKREENDHFAVLCADINEFLKFSHHYGFSVSNQILKIFSKKGIN